MHEEEEDELLASSDGYSYQSSFARALSQASVRGRKAEELQVAKLHECPEPMDETALCSNNDSSWQLQGECQRLLEENRRLRATAMLTPLHDDHEQRAEIALLQSRVSTLSWQLSQSESNSRVLRSVSDQVVSFLDRVSAAMVALEKQRSPPRSGARVPRSRSTHEPRRNVDVASGGETPASREFVPRSSLLRSGSDVHHGDSAASWRRTRASPLDEESANPGRLGQQARRLARTMRSMLSTQEQISSAPPVTAPPPDFAADTSIDPCSLSNLLRSSRRRLSYETPDQRRASFLHQLVEHNKSSVTFHQTSTSIAATSDKNTSDLSVYLTPTLSISSSSEHSSASSSSTSPTRKTDVSADESGFSSMGSFQEIGLPSVYPPPNGLPSLHSRCRSTPVTTQATRIQHSYYRNGENSTAEIATLEKLKVLWV